MVLDQNPIQLGRTVDQSAEIYVNQFEMGCGLGGRSKLYSWNVLALDDSTSNYYQTIQNK